VKAALRSLQDLGALHAALQQREREHAERARRERTERAAAERARQLFAASVGDVTPLRDRGLANLMRAKPAPLPRQREADEREALRQTLADEVDLESLLLTDDGLSFRRPGIAPSVAARLRRGHWSIQAEIDLHGLRRDEAREALLDFVRLAARRGARCLRVVHGKGHGSPGREPVLKGKTQRWLAQCREVIAFAQASGPQGGAGALIVLLDRRAAADTAPR
jgi:DNA-nicking Smr family endonuclease